MKKCNDKYKRLIHKHGFVIAIVAFCIFIMTVTGIGCPIKRIIGFPCPSCGVTRAMLSLLRLDFSAYLSYNAMALPLTLAVPTLMHMEVMKKGALKILLAISSYTAIAIALIYYISRLIFKY